MTTCDKLGLGTVQWGMAYGVSNRSRTVTPAETVAEILDQARCHGVRTLDTAYAYGNSEAVLGENCLDDFRIVTKTPTFATSAITEEHCQALRNAFRESLDRLNRKSIYGLLIHRAEDLLVPNGDRLIETMLELKRAGLVESIGASVYNGPQIDAVLGRFTPDLIQLPLNVLDQRLLIDGHLEALKRSGIEVHVRSVFLQGLLLMPLSEIPRYFKPILPLLQEFSAAAQRQNMSRMQAALAFVRDIPFVDTMLLGFDDLTQFLECVTNFTTAPHFEAAGLSCTDEAFVNPVNWNA